MTSLYRQKQTIIALSLLTLAGVFVRLYGLGAWDYYHDEMWHLYVAQQPTLKAAFYTNLTEDGHPFLPYIIWHFLLGLWDDPWMARLPSLIAGTLCIPMGYLLGRELFKTEEGGWFFAFFQAFSTMMVEQSDVVRGYSMMVLGCMITVWSAYRYRHTPHTKYILIYAASLAFAFFCEFAAAPVAAFAALYLLHAIYQARPLRLSHLGLWALIHVLLLSYLFWFMHLLSEVGHSDFGGSYNFIMMHNYGPGFRLAKLVFCLIDFINEAGFGLFLTSATGSETAGIVILLALLAAVLTGSVWLVRKRQWWLLFWVVSTLVITAAFAWLDLVPLNRSRRNIGLIFPYMILLYGGLAQWFSHLKWKPPVVPATLAAAVMLTIACSAYGGQWRLLHTVEFQQTRQRTQEIFSYLDGAVQKNDAVITDLSSYYHMWRREHCPLVKLAAEVALYPCYQAPLYVITADIRSQPFPLNPAQLQRGLQALDKLHRLDGVQQVWLINIQHAASKISVLDPNYGPTLANEFSLDQRQKYDLEIKRLEGEQKDFLHYAYTAAVKRNILYAFPCEEETEKLTIPTDDHCLMSFIALALPREGIGAHMVHRPAYGDPLTLLYKTMRR